MKHKTHVIFAFVFILSLCLTLTSAAQMETVEPESLYTGSYALIIGISQYKEWGSLRGVRDDVPRVKEALEQMGFQVQVKMNLKDRGALEKAFTSFIKKYGSKQAHRHNRLIFYFAGHGETIRRSCDDELGMGYIVAANAPLPKKEVCPPQYTSANNRPRKRLIDARGFLEYALNMEAVKVYAYDILAKHVLFLFDSCFAGTIFTTRDALEEISYLTKEPVRQFITAGSADETVPDYSLFRREFVAALLEGKGDLDRDGYVTAGELGWYLEKNVVPGSQGGQHPQYGKINHPSFNKGNFVFTLPKSTSTPLRVTPVAGPTQEEFMLDDLEVRNQWRAYQQKVEAAFAKTEDFERNALHTEDKRNAYQRFLEYARQDNPYSERDNELRSLAAERLRDWQNYREPTPEPTRKPTALPTARYQLRKQPMTVSDAKKQQVFNLRDKHYPREYLENEFEVRGPVVIDHATGLTWQQSGSAEYMSYQNAQEYIKQLNREQFGGYNDWRLPTVDELLSLVERNKENDDLYISPKFDKRQRYCWSSDKRSSSSAWLVNFSSGSVDWYSFYFQIGVRCVRS